MNILHTNVSLIPHTLTKKTKQLCDRYQIGHLSKTIQSENIFQTFDYKYFKCLPDYDKNLLPAYQG